MQVVGPCILFSFFNVHQYVNVRDGDVSIEGLDNIRLQATLVYDIFLHQTVRLEIQRHGIHLPGAFGALAGEATNGTKIHVHLPGLNLLETDIQPGPEMHFAIIMTLDAAGKQRPSLLPNFANVADHIGDEAEVVVGKPRGLLRLETALHLHLLLQRGIRGVSASALVSGWSV